MECKECYFLTRFTCNIWTLDHVKVMHSSCADQSKSSVSTWIRLFSCTYQCQALGGESGVEWGFWHFLKKFIKIRTPGQRIIVKISRNKWLTSHLLFKIDRSNAWWQVKIPTLGIFVTVKFPWVARPPLFLPPLPPPSPSGLTLIGASMFMLSRCMAFPGRII